MSRILHAMVLGVKKPRPARIGQAKTVTDWRLASSTDEFREEERRHRNRTDQVAPSQPPLWPRDCPQCDGKGWTLKHFVVPSKRPDLTLGRVICNNCGGSGSPRIPYE